MISRKRAVRAPDPAGRLSRRLAGAVVLALLVAGCGGGGGTALPEEFLGQWHYTGSSGGLTGAGLEEAPGGTIVIRADGTIDRHEEGGALAATTRFTVERGRTIFSTDDLWILDPEEEGPEVVIQLSPDRQGLTLSENVYDGFSRAYARRR